MRWLDGVSGAGVEGLSRRRCGVHPARSPCAWRHGRAGRSHAQRARLRRGTAGARTRAEANKQTNKQTSKQASKQTQTNKHKQTNKPNKRAPTNARMGSREAVAVANHSLLSVVARTAAWHGMARHGMAWRRPSCDTRGEERTPRSTRRMSERACARMPGRLRVGTLRAFGLCLRDLLGVLGAPQRKGGPSLRRLAFGVGSVSLGMSRRIACGVSHADPVSVAAQHRRVLYWHGNSHAARSRMRHVPWRVRR